MVPESPEGLIEGATVSVVANDGETSFTASPEEETALLAALADDEATVSDQELSADSGETPRRLPASRREAG